ncbi:MAG: hypothetical protein KAY24_17250 [Candidatus Eisenbacteria sp.]|nr:hypothetical protein [Candidatus Eisenbacteria bacterium]
MDPDATIYGKNIKVYRTREGRSYRASDLHEFLRPFRLCDALRVIGQTSHALWQQQVRQAAEEPPLSESLLAYLAMILIENACDEGSHQFDHSELMTAADMFYGLPDPVTRDHDLDAGFLRFGFHQFDFDRPQKALLPRTLAIYQHSWPQVKPKALPRIDDLLRQVSGLELNEILALTYAYATQTRQGFFRAYDESRLTSRLARDLFSPEKQRAFVEWLAMGYRDFRKQSRLAAKEQSEYDQLRWNPLRIHPIVLPETNPSPGLSRPCLVPVVRLLPERVTNGLYYELTKACRGPGRQNPFRSAFGPVFQHYVGTLFREELPAEQVKDEWRYGSPKKDTPDFLIMDSDRVVLVEVKQGGLYLATKMSGCEAQVKKDVLKTYAAAVTQLWRFEKDVASGQYAELTTLAPLDTVERVIVTYDRSYFLNSLLRKHILDSAREMAPDLPESFHCHVISVEELEAVLPRCNTGFSSLLEQKRRDMQNDSMDFRDYISRLSTGTNVRNRFLGKMWDSFIGALDDGLTVSGNIE